MIKDIRDKGLKGRLRVCEEDSLLSSTIWATAVWSA